MSPHASAHRVSSSVADPSSKAPRKPRRPRVLEDLLAGSGSPLATGELAHMIGMSSTFVRDEIHGGQLRAVLIGRGRKRVYRIHVREALRYARSLGLL